MVTDFSTYTRQLKPLLDDAIARELAHILGGTEQLESSGGAAALFTGGKRIRGTLVCLMTAALGGSRGDALPRAVAVELIQLATLIHDDFVDQHQLRRHRPALWTLAGARRAVLIGDIIFATAIRMMSEAGRPDCRAVSRTIADLSRGAYHEPVSPQSLLEEIGRGRLDASFYEKVIRLKTGTLFSTACELGATAAGAGDEIRRSCRRYGMKVGEAYQIADDLHDIESASNNRTMTAAEMTGLAPALLHFLPESRSGVTAALRDDVTELSEELRDQLLEAAERMQGEKERRLADAAAEADGMPLDDQYTRLVRRTPPDIIRMLDADARPVSGP